MLPTRPRSISASRPTASIAALMSLSTTSPVGADLLCHAGCEIARAAGDVERALARAQRGLRQRELLPYPMHARRHQVVHQVVVAGDGVEDGAHARGLLVPGDLLVAEIGGGRSIADVRHSTRELRSIAWPASDTGCPAPSAAPGSCRHFSSRSATELVQVGPGVQAGVVAVVEDDAHCIVADRLDGAHADFVLAQLQRLLTRAVAAYFSRW